ncbi:hypothetical protein [uncultured Psychrobacter sp.]|uniref:hypothetical protein n=1 Tax=uncultured Psychrobacter sp. TaxID=259303 RepID=UPI0030DA0F15
MPNWCSNTIDIKGTSDEISQIASLLLNDSGWLDFEVLAPIPKDLSGIYNTLDDGSISFNKTRPERIGLLKPSEFINKLQELYANSENKVVEIKGIEYLFETSGVFLADRTVENSLEIGMNDQTINLRASSVHTNFTPENFVSKIIAAIREDHEQYCIGKYDAANDYHWCLSNWGTKWNVDGEDALIETTDESMYLSFSTPWEAPKEWFQSLLDAVEAMEDNNASIVMNYAEGGCFFGGQVGIDAEGVTFDTEYTDAEIIEFLNLDDDEDFEQCEEAEMPQKD